MLSYDLIGWKSSFGVPNLNMAWANNDRVLSTLYIEKKYFCIINYIIWNYEVPKKESENKNDIKLGAKHISTQSKLST